jgi:hypothetical protein
MMMEEKISYLKKYNPTVTIVGDDEIKSRDVCAHEYRNTIAYLRQYVTEVELIRKDERLSVLYTIRNRQGKIAYYEGGNPKQAKPGEALQSQWDKVPESIRNFYTKVHDGFAYYASESMGLVPLSSVTYLEDEDWGILDELQQKIQLDLVASFGFFSNGMGGYVVIDTSNAADDTATLWFTNKQPKYNLKFWDVVDEWTVIGFDK